MKNIVPYLKLYREYMENLHSSGELIDVWRKKSPAFNAIVQEIEVREREVESKSGGHSKQQLVMILELPFIHKSIWRVTVKTVKTFKRNKITKQILLF